MIEHRGDLTRRDIADRQSPAQHGGRTGQHDLLTQRWQRPLVDRLPGFAAREKEQRWPAMAQGFRDVRGRGAVGSPDVVLHQKEGLAVDDFGMTTQMEDVEVARSSVLNAFPQTAETAALLDLESDLLAPRGIEDPGLLTLELQHRLNIEGRARHEEHPQRTVGHLALSDPPVDPADRRQEWMGPGAEETTIGLEQLPREVS